MSERIFDSYLEKLISDVITGTIRYETVPERILGTEEYDTGTLDSVIDEIDTILEGSPVDYESLGCLTPEYDTYNNGVLIS